MNEYNKPVRKVKNREFGEILEKQGKLVLTAEGNSMLPCIRPRRDVLVLETVKESVRPFQVVLYRRKNGAYVLHRVMEVSDDSSYVLCGDNQWQKEYGVREDQILGVLTGFYRGETFIECETNDKYKRYVKRWCSPLFPRRCVVMGMRVVRKIRKWTQKSGADNG